MKSLSEALGLEPTATAAPKINKKLTAKALAKEILDSEQYRASLERRIVADTLPPAVETLLYHYAHGKPVEKVEVKDTTTGLEELTSEELEARAMALAIRARQLRASDAGTAELSEATKH